MLKFTLLDYMRDMVSRDRADRWSRVWYWIGRAALEDYRQAISRPLCADRGERLHWVFRIRGAV